MVASPEPITANETGEELSASLKALCPRKEIFEAVQTVGHAVSGRTSLPILNHILVRSENAGLRLIATDLELGISCWIPAQMEERGALTAPAKTLSEVLANMPDRGEVALSVDKSHTVRLYCEKSDYKILGLPAEEYPSLPTVVDAVCFSIPQATLRDMIRQTIFAASQDETKAILTGILMVFEGETVKLVSTDTHRLAVKTARVTNGQGSRNAIIPARAMNELIRLLTDGAGDVDITISENQIRFALPGEAGVQIIARLIEGQFPNFQRVIPAAHQRRISVPVDPFLRAVRRAAIVARDNSQRVILRTEEDRLVLTAEATTIGKAYEEIEVLCEGEPIEIAFNAKYLLDVLSVIDAEAVHLDMTEPLKPGVMRPVVDAPEGDPANALEADYLCVLMPMQIV
jgi:DNA polymerase-3 subunit beta